MTKIPCNKTRGVNEPYEVWKVGTWEWRVLKKYQLPKNEAKNPHARWLCAVKSPYTHDMYNLGDTYVKDITNYAYRVYTELENGLGVAKVGYVLEEW